MPDHSFAIPSHAWTRRFDATLEHAGRPSNLSLRAFPLGKAPFILRRILADVRRRRRAGWDSEDVLLVASSRNAPGPHQGVPLGGIGAGTIGRGWRGDFRRWQRRPGIYHHGVVTADQFSLFVQRPSQAAQARTLYPGRPAGRSLSAWQWDMNPACGTYHALYPRAWTVYEQPFPGIRLTCRQLSPILPHNYRESSFPVGHFLWRIENTADTPVTVGLMFTFQNGRGTENDTVYGHRNRAFRLQYDARAVESEGWRVESGEMPVSAAGARGIVGVELQHVHRQQRAIPLGQKPADQQVFEDPLTFAIAAQGGAGVDVSYCSRFVTTGDGAAVWHDFSQDGRLADTDDERSAAAGEAIGAAVAATITVPPGASREIAFALAWDMPVLRAGFGTTYHPRYTKFYGHDGAAAPYLAADALRHADAWETTIAAWQQPILEDPDLPGWYKMALFNELYYLADGGTLWVYPTQLPLLSEAYTENQSGQNNCPPASNLWPPLSSEGRGPGGGENQSGQNNRPPASNLWPPLSSEGRGPGGGENQSGHNNRPPASNLWPPLSSKGRGPGEGKINQARTIVHQPATSGPPLLPGEGAGGRGKSIRP